jgi:hypothetical protein
MNKQMIRKIRNAAISECLRYGIADPHAVRKVLRHAATDVQPMSVAGVQAAFTKGQAVYIIDKVSQNGYA